MQPPGIPGNSCRAVESALILILGDISVGSIISVTLIDPTAVKVHAPVRTAFYYQITTLGEKAFGDIILWKTREKFGRFLLQL